MGTRGNKQKIGSLKKINEIYKPLVRLTKMKKKEDTDGIDDITTEFAAIKNIISKYYKKLMFRNLITQKNEPVLQKP